MEKWTEQLWLHASVRTTVIQLFGVKNSDSHTNVYSVRKVTKLNKFVNFDFCTYKLMSRRHPMGHLKLLSVLSSAMVHFVHTPGQPKRPLSSFGVTLPATRRPTYFELYCAFCENNLQLAELYLKDYQLDPNGDKFHPLDAAMEFGGLKAVLLLEKYGLVYTTDLLFFCIIFGDLEIFQYMAECKALGDKVLHNPKLFRRIIRRAIELRKQDILHYIVTMAIDQSFNNFKDWK